MTDITQPALSRLQKIRKHGFDLLLLLLTFSAGCTATWLNYESLRTTNELLGRERLNAAAQSVMEGLDLAVREATASVRSTSQMIAVQNTLEEREFLEFGERLAAHSHLLRFLEWQPIVPANELQQFENTVAKAGLKNFRITEPGPNGLQPVKPRAQYVPVLFSWPAGSGAIGVDMGFDPARMESKIIARDSGRPTASATFRVINEGRLADSADAFAISMPVYKEARPAGIVARRASITGYVAGVIELPTLLDEALKRADSSELEFILFDHSFSPARQLFSSYSYQGSNPPDGGSTSVTVPLSIEVAGRAWEIVLYPRETFNLANQQSKETIALIIGAIVTLLLCTGLLWLQLGRRRLEMARAASKQAEQALAAERQHLANVLDGTNAGTWECNIQSGEVRFNERWANMLGYQLDELHPLGLETWQALVHPLDLEHAGLSLEQHFKGESEYYQAEFRMRHKNGYWIWVSAHGRVFTRTENGAPEWMAGTHLEITEQKRLNQSLMDLKGALDEHAIVGISDLHGRITSVNQMFCDISGYSREELIGQDHRILNSGHHPKSFFTAMWETLMKGQAWRGQICNRAKDGHIYWVDSTIAPILDADGKPEQFVAIHYEITETKLHEERLIEARNAADQANRAKSMFLANMSHEIRTPMNAIMGLTQLVLNTSLDNQQRDYLEKVHSSSRALLGILNDILDYSKIEAGQLEIAHSPMSVETVLSDSIALFSSELDRKKLEITLELAPEIPETLMGDPLRIGQILNNLLGNAIKFTEHGGIQLCASVQGHTPGGVQLAFTVRDTGIGMNSEQLANIFQPFTQADNTITRRFGGTGLGLSICQKLVALMNGTIDVTSTPGLGSSFHFCLELGLAAGSQPNQARQEFKARKILIASPDEALCENLSRHLSSWGCSVSHASQEARQLIDTIKEAQHGPRAFDALLLDTCVVATASLESLQALHELHTPPSGKPMPVILLSSRAEHISNTLKNFPSLNKPILPGKLHACLKRQLTNPKISTPHAGTPPPVQASIEKYEQARVLLVEDNRINQLVACGLLEAHGIKPEIAENGEMAVRLINANTYDIVLMDQHMPVMDGCEATRLIRSNPENKALPIIAMTAAVLQEDRDRCTEAGMVDFIAKPIEHEQLSIVLKRWIQPARNKLTPAAPRPDTAPSRAGSQLLLAEALPGIELKAALSRIGGNRPLLHSLLQDFSCQARAQLPLLKEAWQTGELEKLRALLHALKGTSSNLGATAVAEAAANLEDSLNSAKASQSYEWFMETLEQTLAILKHALPPPASNAYKPSSEMLASLLEQIRPYLEERELLPTELSEQIRDYCTQDSRIPTLARLQQELNHFEHDAALASITELLVSLHEETGS